MKIPKPQKLPSGSWQVKVMVDGKRIAKTFGTEEAATYWAAGIKTRAKQADENDSKMTVGQAIDAYIESKDTVLSPSTIRNYKALRIHAYNMIERIRVSAITQELIQRQINDLAKTHSPKYVRNAHGLLTATMGVYRPSMQIRTTLPQKVKYDISIPTTEEISKVWDAYKGTKYELPFLLAAHMGLRTSEIRGLTWDCIEGDVLHIKQAMVDGENGATLKTTKTFSSDRRLKIPAHIMSLLDSMHRRDKFIVPATRATLYQKFNRTCISLNIPHYRYHDLRHYYASVMLRLGVPDKYAMEQMGHASSNMLKTVYQHTMEEARKQYAEQINNFFAPAEK